MPYFFIQHELEGVAQKRLNYVLEFLNQHPLIPEEIRFITGVSSSESTVINYGRQKTSDWFIPAQEMFFQPNPVFTHHANSYLHQNTLLYSVESSPQKEQPFFINGTFQFDLFETIFFHISRYEEYFAPESAYNQAGWLAEEAHLLVKNQLHPQPVVDLLVKILLELLLKRNLSSKATFSISHDVDVIGRFTPNYKFFRSLAATIYYMRGWEQLSKSIRHYIRMKKDGLADPYEYFEQLMRKEADWTQKVIYFMTGGNSRYDNFYHIDDSRIDTIIQLAQDRGYSIGLHPSYNAGFSDKMYEQEWQRLSEKVGYPITLNRQHWLRLDWKITPALWKKHGIQQDASIGYNQHLGFRCGTGYAYYLYDFKEEKAYSWLEQPMAFMESAAIHLHVSLGIPLDQLMRRFFDQLPSSTHVEMNFHNSNFDPLLETGCILRHFYEKTLPQLVYEKTHTPHR